MNQVPQELVQVVVPGAKKPWGDIIFKKRVKKLERRKMSRTQGLKRLYKVGSSRRVESSKEEDMFRVHDLDGDEVVVESEARAVSTATATTTTTVITDDEITLAKALAELKSAKPPTQTATMPTPRKGIVFQEPGGGGGKCGEIRNGGRCEKKLEKEQEANVSLTKKWDDIQSKIEADHELA
ncbi:hypothetical protein Tco_1192210 [Tanacetum coccineum]